MSQSQPTRKSRFDEIQMLQQQIMFKQLQELQRQQQLQNFGDVRQQNFINQQALVHKHASGAPIHDPSQMFMLGGMTMMQHGTSAVGQGFTNGLGLSQSQSQGSRSMGLLPSYETSLANVGNTWNQYIHHQGELGRDNNNQAGKNLFGQALTRSMDDGFQSRNSQQFGGRQEQGGWPTQSVSSLDPLEQKILFNMDDNSWEASFGKAGGTNTGEFDNTYENSDHLDDFPCLQSGSWSALMQSAVGEASSSETGLQEEWSGLSFQNLEFSSDNQHSNIVESVKQQAKWLDNNFQIVSSLNSKPVHLVINTIANSNFPGFQQISGTQIDIQPKEYIHSDSYESTQKSPRKATDWSGYDAQQCNSPTLLQGYTLDNHRNFNPSKEAPSRTNVGSGVFVFDDRSSGFHASNITAQTSENMLELLNKVERSKEYEAGTFNGSTDSTLTCEAPLAQNTDASVAQSYNQSSGLQYFGLRLAPPTQTLGNSNYCGSIPIKSEYSPTAFQGPRNERNQLDSHFSVTHQSQQATLSGMGNKFPTSHPPNSQETCHLIYTNPYNQLFSNFGGKQVIQPPTSSGKSQQVAFSTKPSNVKDLEGFTSSRDDSQNHFVSSNLSSCETHRPQISFPMSQSFVKSYGTSKNGQMLPIYEARIANDASHQFSVKKPLEGFQVNTSPVQMNFAGVSQASTVIRATTPNLVESSNLSSPYLLNSDVTDQNIDLRPKKRKFSTLELQPWHKEVAKDSPWIQNISMADAEWAKAVNRLPEKLNDEAGAIEGPLPLARPKKRLVVTAQLMQQLFRPAPAVIFSKDATLLYETVTFFAARLALGDACNLANQSHMPQEGSDLSYRETSMSKGIDYVEVSKLVEDIIKRSKKLEGELFRLEKGGSIVEMRVEFQELEKFSVINRFAKFHSRGGPMSTSETSAATQNVVKQSPQRYVTAIPMPKSVPEGQQCLSL